MSQLQKRIIDSVCIEAMALIELYQTQPERPPKASYVENFMRDAVHRGFCKMQIESEPFADLVSAWESTNPTIMNAVANLRMLVKLAGGSEG